MRALLIGDSHGNTEHVRAALGLAELGGYDCAIHVGDFGWWPVFPTNQFIESVQRMALQYEMPLLVIEGNHDYPGNDENDRDGYRAWRYDEKTLWEPGLKWIPRCTFMEINNQRVLFIGGGISIDYQWREEGYSWWADEALSEQDVEDARKHGKVDILISHDRLGVPNHMPRMSFGITVDEMVIRQEENWRRIFMSANPALHIHGHFHSKYDEWEGEWDECRTIGLSCENVDSICGLNFETMEVKYPEHDPIDRVVRI